MTEKPSIMAELKKHQKQIVQTKKPEPPTPFALDELCAKLDSALQKVKRYDVLLKQTPNLEEWDKLIVERRKAYNEYSTIKAEVKKAEKSLPQKKPRSRDWTR